MRKLKAFLFRFRDEPYKIKRHTFSHLTKKYNKSSIYFSTDYIISSFLYGCDVSEYLIYEFYKLKHLEKREFVTRRNKFKLFRGLNDVTKEKAELFNNKDTFNKVFADYLKRKWIFCGDSSTEEIRDFIIEVKKFIIKPTSEFGGKGIEIKKVEEIKDLNAFVEMCKEKKLLLEEVLIQNKKINRINPDSINTIRPICIRNNKGEIDILSTFIRIGRKGSVVDNISSGGIVFPVGSTYGIVSGPGIDGEGNTFTEHPDSNEIVLGFQIPEWNNIIETAKYATKLAPDFNMVAWDIALAEDGVAIIEGNLLPNPRSMQVDKVGRKKLLEEVLLKG